MARPITDVECTRAEQQTFRVLAVTTVSADIKANNIEEAKHIMGEVLLSEGLKPTAFNDLPNNIASCRDWDVTNELEEG